MSQPKKSTKGNKMKDGKFHSKKIKHDPQAESSRAKNGLQNNTSNGDLKTNS